MKGLNQCDLSPFALEKHKTEVAFQGKDFIHLEIVNKIKRYRKPIKLPFPELQQIYKRWKVNQRYCFILPMMAKPNFR